jgi:hypothetical protein
LVVMYSRKEGLYSSVASPKRMQLTPPCTVNETVRQQPGKPLRHARGRANNCAHGTCLLKPQVYILHPHGLKCICSIYVLLRARMLVELWLAC